MIDGERWTSHHGGLSRSSICPFYPRGKNPRNCRGGKPAEGGSGAVNFLGCLETRQPTFVQPTRPAQVRRAQEPQVSKKPPEKYLTEGSSQRRGRLTTRA